ncbi:hypothetical protein GCM10010174_26070 [Kutzneria viridogrisea]|uniref:Uncharacterized protein n=1 Tax=Kutzneria viridogrisea TaxID=47990 RepID=A0ABR6BRH6_9PSEU|nr:hypothetical protein [Kutzneria viridogrisea]
MKAAEIRELAEKFGDREAVVSTTFGGVHYALAFGVVASGRLTVDAPRVRGQAFGPEFVVPIEPAS